MNDINNETDDNPYDYAIFQTVLESAASIREATHEIASLNIEESAS